MLYLLEPPRAVQGGFQMVLEVHGSRTTTTCSTKQTSSSAQGVPATSQLSPSCALSRLLATTCQSKHHRLVIDRGNRSAGGFWTQFGMENIKNNQPNKQTNKQTKTWTVLVRLSWFSACTPCHSLPLSFLPHSPAGGGKKKKKLRQELNPVNY